MMGRWLAEVIVMVVVVMVRCRRIATTERAARRHIAVQSGPRIG